MIICDKCRMKREEDFELFDYHFCKECKEDLNVITIHWVMNMCEFKEQKKKTVNMAKIDWDKACALKMAGWSNEMIADELDVDRRKITQQLSRRYEMYRHGMRWGKPYQKEEEEDGWDL